MLHGLKRREINTCVTFARLAGLPFAAIRNGWHAMLFDKTGLIRDGCRGFMPDINAA